MREFIAIDLETANPKRVSACSIGLAFVANNEVVKSEERLIKPIGGHAEFQSRIHGIKDEHTCNQPDFGELFFEIAHIFDAPLVAHSGFDRQVLNALSGHFKLDLSFDYTDTVGIARESLPHLKNHKLKTLAKHFQLPPFRHHNAEEDAIACANVYMNLVSNNSESQSLVPETEIFEFKGLISGILADDNVDYREAYELLYWLEDHVKVAAKCPQLYTATKQALDDDWLDETESVMIKDLLQSVRSEIEALIG